VCSSDLFPKDVSYAFANGLASSGWRVEITTASSQAPSDVWAYSLLVLAFPVYGGKPGDAIVRYIDRTSNFNGISTVIIALDGLNSPGGSVDTMKQKVQALNGTFYESLTLWSGSGSATDSARQAGHYITP
jgi:flavorubredoxin